MTVNVPQHNHCHVCMKAIPYGETLCSEECKQKYTKLLKRRRLIVYFMYAMLIALIAIFILYNRVV